MSSRHFTISLTFLKKLLFVCWRQMNRVSLCKTICLLTELWCPANYPVTQFKLQSHEISFAYELFVRGPIGSNFCIEYLSHTAIPFMKCKKDWIGELDIIDGWVFVIVHLSLRSFSEWYLMLQQWSVFIVNAVDGVNDRLMHDQSTDTNGASVLFIWTRAPTVVQSVWRCYTRGTVSFNL